MQESRRLEHPRTPLLAAAALALAFLALHLPYIPNSLEDVDSINFALGLQQFDVARHQPHPPGYPLYIGLGKIVRTITASEPRALGTISVVTGALGIVALAAFFTALERRRAKGSAATAIGATALALTAPLYWFTAVRPLSDVPGLALSLAILAVTFGGPATVRRVCAAAFLVALGAGLRSQVVWLTAPFLLFVLVRDASGFRQPSTRTLMAAVAGLAAGILAWAIPLLVLTGGLRA